MALINKQLFQKLENDAVSETQALKTLLDTVDFHMFYICDWC